MRKYDCPYEECLLCKTIDDCKHADKSDDEMSSALPPDNCPKSMEVMRHTLHKRKLDKFKNQS